MPMSSKWSLSSLSDKNILCIFHLHHAVIVQSVQWLGYGLDDWGSRVQFPAGAENFSLYCPIQNDSGTHPASYLMGNMGSFPGAKGVRAWSWPLTSI
jgi:hypothetical protein